MRYDWVGAKTGPAERVGSVLRFDRVLKVSHLGLKDKDWDATLNLLAVTFEKTDPPAGMIILAFADGALVRLEVECVEVELQRHGAAPPRRGLRRPRPYRRVGFPGIIGIASRGGHLSNALSAPPLDRQSRFRGGGSY